VSDERLKNMGSNCYAKRILNVGLRGLSLASKLVLTFYMGKYLGLADLGLYGLVFAVVTISSAALGMRLDYAMARNLVGASEVQTTHLILDQVIFYTLNYGLYALLMAVAYVLDVASGGLLVIIFIISIFENLSGAFTTNLIAMGSPLLSTTLFFVRSGLWSLIVVALGLIFPAWRSVNIVLAFWAGGEVLAVVLNAWVWRRLPWRAAWALPIDWQKMMASAMLCFPMWLGTIGGILALSVDRFVVSYFLDLEKVGVITFYGSFATALLSMVQSGFFAFAYPRMIHAYRKQDRESFVHETRKTGWEAALFVALTGVALGGVIPLIAPYLNKPEFAAESYTLWLLIIAVWLRTNADTLYYVLYAQQQDKPLWLGAILCLAPAAGCNVIFVPWAGLPGVGYSAILTCLFLLLWRLRYVFGRDRKFIFRKYFESESNCLQTAEKLD